VSDLAKFLGGTLIYLSVKTFRDKIVIMLVTAAGTLKHFLFALVLSESRPHSGKGKDNNVYLKLR
jgi:hypothetical protein